MSNAALDRLRERVADVVDLLREFQGVIDFARRGVGPPEEQLGLSMSLPGFRTCA